MEKRPKDHFVAKTYMKAFTFAPKMLWTYDKLLLNKNSKSPSLICKDFGWSDNPYFSQQRVIDDYLKVFENRWNEALEVFLDQNSGSHKYIDAKKILAGYIACLKFNTPAAVKAGESFLQGVVMTEAMVLRDQKLLPQPPPGYEFLLTDLENQIKVDVESKYAQALGAGKFQATMDIYFSAPWTLVYNRTAVPFLTSDNPVCMWYRNGSDHGLTYVPLTPTSAVVIHGNESQQPNGYNQSKEKVVEATEGFVSEINDLVIKSSERVVISNIDSEAILAKVIEFRSWKFRCVLQRIPERKGFLILHKWGAVDTQVGC